MKYGRIEQTVTFASEREEFSGEMMMTWTFDELEGNTFVTVECTNVPEESDRRTSKWN